MPSRTHWHFASNVVSASGEHQLPGAPDAWVANPYSHSWLKREAAKKCVYIKEQFLQNDTNVNLT
ncbi:hypothetical protein VTG60DRAFT_883 [Thermothelomyces hinnuleus]